MREYYTQYQDYIDNVATRPVSAAMLKIKAPSEPIVYKSISCHGEARQGVYTWKCYLTLNHDGLHSTGAISWPDDYTEIASEQCHQTPIQQSACRCIRKIGHLGKHFAHTGNISKPPYSSWSSYVEFETPHTGNRICNSKSPLWFYYCQADFGHSGLHTAEIHDGGIKNTYTWR